ncbi:MAG: hypothetical protein IPP07_09470 [Holophagales bacterium]|nr:hypothetical protein [Holophagales bacterium]MBK9965099.1 hypothetical protein [Holophagales bacterium]
MRTASCLAIGVLLALPSVPAGAAGPTLKARAEALKPFLPSPPKGWSIVEEETIGQDSAVAGSELTTRRRYRKGSRAEEVVEIQIGIKPDGKPLWPAVLIDDPAKAAKQVVEGVPFSVTEVLGHKALTRSTRNPMRNRAEHRVLHKLPNNVSVSYEIWTLPISEAEQFRKAIDYGTLGTLRP